MSDLSPEERDLLRTALRTQLARVAGDSQQASMARALIERLAA